MELLYFAAFLFLALRVRAAADERRVLVRFALLLFGGFVVCSLFGGLVLLDSRLGVPALLVYFGSNLVPLFYLRAVSDTAFKPVKAEIATPKGIEHTLTLHGITKRERQVVETDLPRQDEQADRRRAIHQPADRQRPHAPHLLEARREEPHAARAGDGCSEVTP